MQDINEFVTSLADHLKEKYNMNVLTNCKKGLDGSDSLKDLNAIFLRRNLESGYFQHASQAILETYFFAVKNKFDIKNSTINIGDLILSFKEKGEINEYLVSANYCLQQIGIYFKKIPIN